MSISLNNVESRVTALEKMGFVKYPNYSNLVYPLDHQTIPTSDLTLNYTGWLILKLNGGNRGNCIYVNDKEILVNWFISEVDNDSNSCLIPCYPGIKIRAKQTGAYYNIILNL